MALRFHFLNVGHGDCTIIEFPSGNLTVVDVNNSDSFDPETEKEVRSMSVFDSMVYESYKKRLVNPIEYIQSNFPGKSVFRFIATHPDMDHLSGLSEFYFQKIPIVNFWDTGHGKDFKESDFSGTKYKWADWVAYKYYRHTNTTEPKTLELYRGANADFYGANHDNVEIWSPTPELIKHANEAEEYNHLSYVLSVKYGQSHVVLGGDASDTVTWPAIFKHFNGKFPKVSILKASHHGRDSGYHPESVSAMNPDYVILSVGKKPSTDASNKYRAVCNGGTYTTRYHGTIIADCYSDGTIFLKDTAGNFI